MIFSFIKIACFFPLFHQSMSVSFSVLKFNLNKSKYRSFIKGHCFYSNPALVNKI